MAEPPKTVAGVLKAGTDYLAGKGVPEPRAACERLLGRLLQCPCLELPLRRDAVLDEKRLEAMRRGVRRVAAGEPVQYVLGRTEFFGHTFKTDRRALIPRPETEILVEEVLACAPLWETAGTRRPAVVDVGTGSGCVVISLALARPQALYVGLDPSAEAVALARENAAALGVADRVAFAVEELSDSIEPESLDAVAANLPYVATAEYENLPRHIRDHEPRSALDGGPDGLAVIREVVPDASCALRTGGRLFLEIAAGQKDSAASLLEGAGFRDVRARKDLAGVDRIVSGVLR